MKKFFLYVVVGIGVCVYVCVYIRKDCECLRVGGLCTSTCPFLISPTTPGLSDFTKRDFNRGREDL